MPQLIARLFGIDWDGRLNRLIRLAAEMDGLLIGGALTPMTRRQLEEARQGLEERIRELMAA